jgi:hypothetical protein
MAAPCEKTEELAAIGVLAESIHRIQAEIDSRVRVLERPASYGTFIGASA